MNTEEKLEKLKKLADAMYYAAQQLTTDASRLHKAMDEYHKFIINEYHKKEYSEDLEEFINTIKLLTSNTALLTFEYGCHEGAKWQKQQDQSIIELAEDHAMLAGMEKMKQQLLAKAVDATIAIPYQNGNDGYSQIVDSKEALPFGENLKVLVTKEN